VTSVPPLDALFFARLAAGRAALGQGIRIATDGAIARPAVELTIEIFTPADPLRGDALLRMESLQASMELSESELKQWAGYSLDLFGAPLDGPLTHDGGPTWTIAWEDPAKPPGTTRLLRQRARYKSSPLVAEQLWIPGDRERYRVDVLEPDATYSRDAAERAFRGLALLRRHALPPRLEHAQRRRRPPAYTDAEEPRFFEALKAASHKAVAEGESLSYASLVRHGLGSWRTVEKYVEHFKYDLEAIEREANHCTRGLNFCRFIARDRAKFKQKGV
jgi:hypothetical protein